jgi:hypothetical protein
MESALTAITTLAAACFAGGALYVSLVEHPARMRAGLTVALAEFVPSYARASVWQGGLAAVALGCGIAAAVVTGRTSWLWAALLVGAAIPWTLAVMMPTNRQLTAATDALPAPQSRALLDRWARLHAVRTVLGCAGLLAATTG